MKVSLLDYGLVDEGKTSAEKLLRKNIKELAQLAELGFHRFWVSEHHNVPTLDWRNW